MKFNNERVYIYFAPNNGITYVLVGINGWYDFVSLLDSRNITEKKQMSAVTCIEKHLKLGEVYECRDRMSALAFMSSKQCEAYDVVRRVYEN